MSKRLLTDDYGQLSLQYAEKYGHRTCVLIQIGNFYEIYQYVPSEIGSTDTPWGHAVELSSVLNMVLTRKNKNEPHSSRNPYLVGFPLVAYEKNRDVILRANFTIVRIDQNGEGAKVDRSVSEVIGPATEVDFEQTSSNRLITLYIEGQNKSAKSADNLQCRIGIACLDVSTGKSIVHEALSSPIYPSSALQDVYRFLISMSPRQVLIYLDPLALPYKSALDRLIESSRYPMVDWRTDFPSDYRKIGYQTTLMEKIFRLPSPMEQLNFEFMDNGRLAFVLLLQYCYDHNPILLNKIEHPITTWDDRARHLVLTHNAVVQLDLLGAKKCSPPQTLLDIIDFTTTAIGRRRLRDLVANPYTEPAVLETMYGQVDLLLTDTTLQPYLKKMPDLERLHRKIHLLKITPLEFVHLTRGYHTLRDLLIVLITTPAYTPLHSLLPTNDEISAFNNLNVVIDSVFDLDRLEGLSWKDKVSYNFSTGSPLKPGRVPAYDALWTEYTTRSAHLGLVVTHLNSFLASSKGKKLEAVLDTDHNGLLTTEAKGRILKASPVDGGLVGVLRTLTVKAECLVTSDLIDPLVARLRQLETELGLLLKSQFLEVVAYLSSSTASLFSGLVSTVGRLDVVLSHALCAKKYHYFRPSLVEREASYVDFEDLRHPLVEQIIDTRYIPNDLSFKEIKGYLLYGLNSAGKSTLVKSIGLNLIMAQIGMFTASKMTYWPYRQIITRLSGNDNLLKGESSFIVEMMELRTILRQADRNTMVLGDELCRGTENVSGASLTVSTLLWLKERGVSFIFSTHLHHLPEMEEVATMVTAEELKIYHLSTLYNETTDQLEYHRKLEPGAGDSLYGLEVAKSLHLDAEFLRKTFEIRRRLLSLPDSIVNLKKSRYCSQVYMDECCVCGARTGLQSHHLKEQHLADEHGRIETFDKDRKFNLVVVCEKCHHQIHE